MISARSRSSAAGFDTDPRSRVDLGSIISARSRSSPPSGRPLRPPPPAAPSLPPPSPPSANARPALPRPSDAPPPSPEPPRHACAPRRRPERPSGPLRPASAPSAAATRVHRSRAAVMTGTPHGPTAPTRVATAVRSRVAPPPHPRFDPLRLTAPHNLLWVLEFINPPGIRPEGSIECWNRCVCF